MNNSMPTSADRSQTGSEVDLRTIEARTRSSPHPGAIPEGPSLGEIIFRAPRGTVDKVAHAFAHESELVGDEVRRALGFSRYPKEALATLERLGFVARVPGAKKATYQLTPRGGAYIVSDKARGRMILEETLTSDRGFVSFWERFTAGRSEFTSRDLASYISRVYGLSPTTGSLYASYALNFLRFLQLVHNSVREKFTYRVRPLPGISRGEGRPSERVLGSASLPSQTRNPGRGPPAIKSPVQLSHALYECAARLAEIGHSDTEFKILQNRTDVSRTILGVLAPYSASRLGQISSLVTLARRDAVDALREGNRVAVLRSFHLMIGLAKLVAEQQEAKLGG